jgi:Ser/Thr protein kinase RdoA (MazF antagonist)
LRSFDPRPEALRLAGHEPALREAAARLELPDLPARPIHGDAHLGNVLAGGRWLDFDEACSGPPEWDLACLRHRLVVFGELRAEIEAALAAYGDFDEEAVAACDPLVVLFTATWGIVTQPSHPRTRARVDWLRRFGT